MSASYIWKQDAIQRQLDQIMADQESDYDDKIADAAELFAKETQTAVRSVTETAGYDSVSDLEASLSQAEAGVAGLGNIASDLIADMKQTHKRASRFNPFASGTDNSQVWMAQIKGQLTTIGQELYLALTALQNDPECDLADFAKANINHLDRQVADLAALCK